MIENEIDKAKQIFRRYGDSLLEDLETSCLLKQYRNAIEHSWKTMKNLEVTDICGKCAEKEPGGCCFQDFEKWYSDIQLLMNMFMGVDIPMTRMYDNSCMFVGEKGCRLLSRNAFCINFLCDKIKDGITSNELNNLNSTAGTEIDCGIRLENALIRWLSDNREIK